MIRVLQTLGRLLGTLLLAGSMPAGALAAPEPDPAAPPEAKAIERALAAVVGLRARALEDARSASTLGSNREGSGVVIGEDGLVLTIGYLVIEADSVALDLDDGRTIPARVVAYDVATGLALVQALAPLGIAPAPLGRSDRLPSGEPLVVVSGGDSGAASMVRLAARREFSGYWEYHLDAALFTAPARARHSGAALFDARGALVGVGSLALRDLTPYGVDGDGGGRRGGNLFVPADLLPPILAELRRDGRSAASVRAWIGINCVEDDGAVRVVRVTDDSPADVAGLQAGDRILRLDGRAVGSLAQLWQALWAGRAQREVALEIERDREPRTVSVHTIDRAASLRRPEGI